jgi:hypothetical protein
MAGLHRTCWITCLLVVIAAMLEIVLGVCIINDVDHAALGRLYLGLSAITLLGLHELCLPSGRG